jgi:hypothetical protein
VLELAAGKRAGSVAPWGDETIFGDLKSGTSLDDVKKSKFVDRITDIYALIFEADEWEAAHGKIDNGTFIPMILSGLLNGVFEKMAKGQPITSGP